MNENIIEIFSTVQGEGKYVGCRQVFLRLEGCNLHCSYCDTDSTVGMHPDCVVEEGAGTYHLVPYPNPISPQRTAELVEIAAAGVPHQALSITGGEPLLHAAFIRALAPHVQLPIYLETNGTLHEELKKCIDCVAGISMDIKLPSATTHPVWDAHERFLEIAKAKDTWVKIVVAAESPDSEVDTAIRLVADTAPESMLILQPVTPYGGCTKPSPEQLLAWQENALRRLAHVRVIPQTHRMMDML